MTTVRNKILQIYQDDDAGSPRECDNLGTMACWHNRYHLGDVQPELSPEYFKISLISEYINDDFEEALGVYADFLLVYRTWTQEQCDYHTTDVVNEIFDEYFISLPVHLLDHSGLSMSTGPFSCPWDSGQVGFIFVPASVAHDELNGDGKSFPQIRHTVMGDREFASLRDLTQHYLRGEVEVYDQYLRGETYGFVLLDEDDEEENSCWGFIGSNWRTNGIADHVDLTEVKEVHRMEPCQHTTMEPAEVEELT